jgi:hypothetical protein
MIDNHSDSDNNVVVVLILACSAGCQNTNRRTKNILPHAVDFYVHVEKKSINVPECRPVYSTVK